MSHILERDVYSKNGTLLLRKGQIVTNDTLAKLKKYGSYMPSETNENSAVQDSVSSKTVHTFRERKKIRNNQILELPTKILNTIIFESKTKPWWIYVNALANYVNWVYTHSIDVAMISLMIAVELKYNGRELWNIGLGAFLHDTGKLLIPKRIIQKPGPSTDTEMVYIRQHCDLGMSLIEHLCLSNEITDIILQHHERLDGSGYPNGLTEDEISLNAKIVMVADSVDAITSGRPYRRGQEMDKVGGILKRDEGKYPPEILAVLERILDH